MLRQPELGAAQTGPVVTSEFCPLTLELQVGGADDWLDTGTTSSVANSTSWKITEAFF